MACLRDDLDVLVTQGFASWSDVMDLTRRSAQLSGTQRKSYVIRQVQVAKLCIYEAIGLDLLYLSIYVSIYLSIYLSIY